MAGSIADFKSSFRKEVARTNRFDVFIPIPLGLSPFLGESRALALRCENAQLPSRNISTAPSKIYGVTEEYPYASTFDDVSLTFVVTEDMKEKNLFDSWMNYINPISTYNVKYKNQYAVPIVIRQYDLQNKLTMSVTLLDAYPKAMNQMDLDWASDAIHKVTVTFAYTSWRNNSVDSLAMEFIDAGNFNDNLAASLQFTPQVPPT
jgi:hypothetical protein